MKTKSGFTLLSRAEFQKWMTDQEVTRQVRVIQNHHTFVPDYTHFNGENHFEKLEGMRDFHMNARNFSDIAQHFTTFPDGAIGTGRSLERDPAGIKGQNSGAICLEHLGNFDEGADEMTEEHRKTIIFLNAVLCKKFKLTPDENTIVYHHWFDQVTGLRTGGSGITKTCPGTNFFGGNTIGDSQAALVPLIRRELAILGGGSVPTPEPVLGHGWVRANQLNVRRGPGTEHRIVSVLNRGIIVPIFEIRDRWARINQSGHWASKNYLTDVSLGVVIDDDPAGLNVRTGPGGDFRRIKSLLKGTEVVIYEQSANGWMRISVLDQWVYGKYVEITSPS